jgi:O-antigen/teichoic acid export membrane protein
MNKTGVRFRVLISVATNVSRVALGFATGLIIARALGPADYGNLNFLLGSFAAFANLLDMGTSSAFYTFLSQKGRGGKFLFYYAVWIMIQLVILLGFVLVLPSSLKQGIWLGQNSNLILLALLASFSMNQIWTFTGQVGESIRDTLGVQMRNLVLTLAYLFSVIGLLYLHLVSIQRLLVANALLYVIVALVYWIKLYQRRVIPRDIDENLSEVLLEFKGYVFPLMTTIGFCYAFLDPWLLQKFGGSVQQGFYSVGAKVASISFVASTAISQVLWKEIAESYRRMDHERVRLLFGTFARGLYLIPAIVGCSLIPFTKEILAATVGFSYISAWLPFSIMLLYPIHQSLNIVYDITLLATGRTRTRSRIVIFFFLSSIVASYIFLAPRTALVPGFALGAVGLTLKMVFCQIMQTSLNGYYASKHIGSSFDWIFQGMVLALLVPLGFACKYLTHLTFSALTLAEPAYLVLGASSLIYLSAIALVLYRFPLLAGMSRQQLNAEIIAIKRWAYSA